jgi:hypothetical protein
MHRCLCGKTLVLFRKWCTGYFLITHQALFLYAGTIFKWCMSRPNLTLEK